MTHTEFIFLLILYFGLVVASFMRQGSDLGEKELLWLKNLSKPYKYMIAAVGVLLITMGLVGFIGLLFLWSLSPYVFFGAVAARVVTDYSVLGDQNMKGKEALIAHGTFIFEIMLAYIVFLGPAKDLFHV